MLFCVSCSQKILSRTVWCGNCNTPYHASCSFKSKVTSGGYNICCGTLSRYKPYARPNQSNNPDYVSKVERTAPKASVSVRQVENLGSANDSDDDIIEITVTNSSSGLNTRVNNDNNSCLQEEEEEEDDDVVEIEPTEVETINCDEEKSEMEEELEDVNENISKIEKEEDARRLQRSESRLNPLVQLRDNKVTLDTVWNGISTLQSSISNISTSMTTVSSRINNIDPRLKAMENSIKNVQNQAEDLKNTQNEVMQLRQELRKVRDELEELKKRPMQTNITVGTIVAELKLRELKSHNVLIYDVPEDNLAISEDCTSLDDRQKFETMIIVRDTARAKQILGVVPNLDLGEIRTKRIGKFCANKVRPLMVILSSHEDVIHIFKNRKLINSKYPIKSDLTFEQRAKIKDLQGKLEKINTNTPNPTMTIKYVNGEPTLIPLRNFKFDQLTNSV